jgi:hypothetical protein
MDAARRRPTAAMLFLGTLEPRKNVGGLLDAWERLADHGRLDAATTHDSGVAESDLARGYCHS